MSPELQGFYNAMAKWVNAGTPYNNPLNFWEGYGLCANLGNYLDARNVPNDTSDKVKKELTEQFIEACLTPLYPFNDVEISKGEKGRTFLSERRENVLYKNPYRLAWIYAHRS